MPSKKSEIEKGPGGKGITGIADTGKDKPGPLGKAFTQLDNQLKGGSDKDKKKAVERRASAKKRKPTLLARQNLDGEQDTTQGSSGEGSAKAPRR